MSPPAAPGAGSAKKAPSTSQGEQVKGGVPAQERELRAQGKKTMRKLLDAAMVVFDRRGYHAARVDDIVKVARTSHGTFYLYFANKEDIFRALVGDVAEEMLVVADSLGPISSGPSGYREVRRWLASFCEVYWRYGPVVRAWTDAATDQGEFAPLGRSVAQAFSRTLSRRVRESSPPAGVDPRISTLAMVAMIERSNYYLLLQKEGFDREAVVDTLAAIVHQGLFGGSRRATRAPRTARAAAASYGSAR